ncbi:MAG: ABC transporter permease [Lachnospiraceae bacterium]|jgi:ABC-2 type transport system permease protein
MNVKRYDLTKTAKILMLLLTVTFAAVDLIGWNRLCESRLHWWGVLLAEAVLYGAAAFFCVRMAVKDKKGEETALGNFFQTIARYEFLIQQLVERDFKIKYKRSVLGVFWSFLNPLLMMIVQYVVFSNLLNVRDGSIQHYAIYLLCGIVMFNGFNDCCNQSMRAIIGNASLITKVYVPKVIYPVTKVLSASINIVLSMVPLLLVTVIYGLFNGLYLHWSVLLIPLALVFLIMFCIGMGLLLSCLMVFFRDTEFLWSVISTMWMYATPIIYSTSLLERGGAHWLAQLEQFNALYHYVDFLRVIIIDGQCPALREFVICFAFGLGMILFGWFVFHKNEDKFVLYI